MAEREQGWLEKYKKVNIATAVLALTIIGGSVGLALAAFDAAQVGAIEYYQRKKKNK